LLCWLVIALIFIIVAFIGKQDPKVLFRLKHLSIKNGLASIMLGIGLVFIMNGAVRFLGELSNLKFSYMNPSTFKGYDLIYLAVIVGLITPVFEELFFRGIIISRLEEGYGHLSSILISSVLFSVSHLNLVQSVYVLPLGILAGVLVLKTGSIISSVLLHMMYNILNIYLAKINFFQYNGVQLLVMICLGLVLVIFGLGQIDEQITE
jgi:membrane protease YdiL (CAAX protease family)